MSFQFDNHKNLAVGHILTAPAIYTPTTSFTLQPGEGALFSGNMPVTMVPSGQAPERNNAEIGYIDDIQGDEVFVVRAQEGTEARDVKAGWIILGTTTAKTLTDIESAVQATKDAVDAVPTAHGELEGLDADDHTQYHTNGRGDARYYKKSEVDTATYINPYKVPFRNNAIAGPMNDFISVDQAGASGHSLVRRKADGGVVLNNIELNGANVLSGTGFPNGVVSAPVGSIYIDKAITNGASSWIKKAGTGNTGWQVLEGDTGWRDIGLPDDGSIIPGPAYGAVLIRRIGSNIIFRLRDVEFTTSDAIPMAFSATYINGFFGGNTNIYSPIYRELNQVGNGGSWYLGIRLQATAGINSNLYMQWQTTQAWPPTLPGTAA